MQCSKLNTNIGEKLTKTNQTLRGKKNPPKKLKQSETTIPTDSYNLEDTQVLLNDVSQVTVSILPC